MRPTDQRARAFTRAGYRYTAARVCLAVALLAGFYLSGLSDQLIAGLESRFSHWFWVNAVYVGLAFFGYFSLAYPLHLYGDFMLNLRYENSDETQGEWINGYFRYLMLECLLAVLFFGVLFTAMHFSPDWWWVMATAVYSIFCVGLGAYGTSSLIPGLSDLEAVRDPELVRTLHELADKSGIRVEGVAHWSMDTPEEVPPVLLAGRAANRRFVLSEKALEEFEDDELVAMAAHEIGLLRNKANHATMIAGSLLGLGAFLLTHLVLTALSITPALAAFPITALCLVLFGTISHPVSNGLRNRLHYAADEYAVRATRSARPLIRVLEKLAAEKLIDREPPRWLELMFHSEPSIRRRTERATRLEEALVGKQADA